MTTIQLTAVSYDTKGACAAVGVSDKTLQTAVRNGDLIAHFVGSKPLYRAVDLDEWVRSLPTESTRQRT